jgi:hypothetical protein
MFQTEGHRQLIGGDFEAWQNAIGIAQYVTQGVLLGPIIFINSYCTGCPLPDSELYLMNVTKLFLLLNLPNSILQINLIILKFYSSISASTHMEIQVEHIIYLLHGAESFLRS